MSSPNPARPERQGYVPELDGIRGIAIAVVMILHFIASPLPNPQNLVERVAVGIAGYGMWGVDLFFVLSGYLITGLLWDSRSSGSYFSSFFMRRALRIFPLYFGVIFLLVVLLPRGLLAERLPDVLEIREVQVWLWTYLTNVYIAIQGGFVIPYVSHFWTLAIEEHFYLLWPFLVRFASRRTIIATAMVLCLGALGSRIALAFAPDNHMWAHTFTLCRLDSLCIGGMVALWVRGERGWSVLDRAVRLFPVVAVVMLVLLVVPMHGDWGHVSLALKQFVLAILFAFLIGVAAWPSGWPPVRVFLRWPPLMALGRYSYGLYVFHGIIAYFLVWHGGLDYFAGITGSRTSALFLQAIVGAGASLVISVASYHLYEAPFLRLKRYFKT